MTATRWGFSGWSLCMPRYCVFSYACPVKAMRQGPIETYRCLRYLPADRQPPAALSPFAVELLERLRRRRQAQATLVEAR